MDLGRARLRKIGLNNLHCAVHPHHGVIWTDGKGIYLAPIQVEGHQVQNAASVKVGEFENVTSVHWSSNTNADSCHMCVVHQQNVTVWRVSGALPKLIFKQVRKINVRPVSQGCLWNPHSDVLCLLSRHQCSFYFRHDMNKANYAFPALESSSIACGCWSPDGTKLILCVGAALLIYRWSDVNAAIEDFSATAWRIPGLEGKLTSIAPVLKDSVVVAAEVPLESLCKQQDMFKVPDAVGDNKKNSDGVIRPNKSSSATESLLNLQSNTQVITDSRSSLTMIHLPDGSHDPIKLSTVLLKGAITPDVLMYERSSQCVVVGSNSQNQLHIYALLEKHLAYCGNIQLDKDQRPKGLCSMPTFFDDRGAALLILVGQREVVESGLTPLSTEADFRLSMKYIILKAGYNHHSRHNGRGDSIKERSSDHSKSSSLIKSENLKPHHVKNLSDSHVQTWSDCGSHDEQKSDSRSPDDQIKVPSSATEESLLESEELLIKPQDRDSIHKEKLIDDLSSDPSSHTESLEVDTVPFSSVVPSFNNSKLAAEYSLDPASSATLNDQTDSLHSSVPKDIQLRQAACDDDGKTYEISQLRLSRETQPQSAFEKYPKSDKKFKKDDNSESHLPQKQESCSGDTNSDICHPQNSLPNFNFTYNDQGGNFPENTSTLLHHHKESFFSSLQSEIKPEINIPSQTKTESDNHFLSLKSEIKPDIMIPSQTKAPSQTKTETQSHFPSSQSEIKPEIIIPSQTKIETQNHLPSLQSEIKPEIIIPSQTKTDSHNKFPSLQPEIKPEILATFSQTETDSLSHFSILQTETKPKTTTIPSHTELDSPNYFPSVQTEVKPPGISSQTKTDSLIHFSSLNSEIKPQISAISSQTKTDSPIHFSSLNSEIKPQISAISSQAKTDSPNHFSSLNSEIKPQISAISSQTKTDSPSHFSSLHSKIKPQISAISSQTRTDSPSHFSSLNSEIIPQISAISSQTDAPIHFSSLNSEIKPQISAISSQTKTDSLSHFPSLQSDMKLPKTPSSFGAEEGSPEHFYSLKSELLANSDEDNSELSYLSQSLRGQDLDQVKDDTLSDLGFRSSQYSADSVWDALEKQTKSQKDNIDALHQRLELLSTAVDKTSCVFPTKYQDISKPETIEISCEKPEGTEIKMFLLDNCRLQLEPVKMAFGLATVELLFDGVPCVLGSNIDGYIPLKFYPFTKLHISGQPLNK